MLQILFLLNGHPKSVPAARGSDIDPRLNSAMRDAADFWSNYTIPDPAGELRPADPEDWMEEFSRLRACREAEIASGGQIRLVIGLAPPTRYPMVDEDFPHNMTVIQPASGPALFDPALPFVLGSPASDGMFRTLRQAAGVDLEQMDSVAKAEKYWSLKGFRNRISRQFDVVGFDVMGDIGTEPLVNGLLHLKRRGVDRAFLKACAMKKGVETIDLSEMPLCPKGAGDWIYSSGLIEGWMHLFGQECFMIQEHVAMQGEYRVAVVGGRPRTGSPVCWPMTPQHRDVRYDMSGFDIRYASTPRAAIEDLAMDARYALSCRHLAAEMALDLANEGVPDFVVDFYRRPDGQPEPIEINPLPNSGLYAMDPGAILGPLVERGFARERAMTAEGKTSSVPAVMEMS